MDPRIRTQREPQSKMLTRGLPNFDACSYLVVFAKNSGVDRMILDYVLTLLSPRFQTLLIVVLPRWCLWVPSVIQQLLQLF